MTTLEDLKRKWMRDPEFRRCYEASAPKYEEVRSRIDERGWPEVPPASDLEARVIEAQREYNHSPSSPRLAELERLKSQLAAEITRTAVAETEKLTEAMALLDELKDLPTPEEAEAAMIAATPRVEKLMEELYAIASTTEEPLGPLVLGVDPDYVDED